MVALSAITLIDEIASLNTQTLAFGRQHEIGTQQN
jgi:hypothetical protein